MPVTAALCPEQTAMTPRIQQALLAGLAGTAAMSAVTMIAPMMGLPKMSPPGMLAMMVGAPMFMGWLMHFMIGIVFALAYALFFQNIVKNMGSPVLRGAVFGMATFVFAQVMMMIMGAMMGGMPPMEGSKAMLMLGSIIGHLVFGIVVAMLVKPDLQPKTR